MENILTKSSAMATISNHSTAYPSWTAAATASGNLTNGNSSSFKRVYESSNDISNKVPRIDGNNNQNNLLPGVTTFTTGIIDRHVSAAPVSQLITPTSTSPVVSNSQLATPQPSTSNKLPTSSGASAVSSPSPTSPGSEEQDSSSSRSKANRLLSQSKRAIQNRTAQRAFRQRKELYIRDLETKVDELKEAHRVISELKDENTHLRDYVLALQSRFINEPGLPAPPAVYKLYRRGIPERSYGNDNGTNSNSNDHNYSHNRDEGNESSVSDGRNRSD